MNNTIRGGVLGYVENRTALGNWAESANGHPQSATPISHEHDRFIALPW
jgi:hypothetical protein